MSECLFNGKVADLTDKEIELVFKGVPEIPFSDQNLIEVLVEGKIATSKREAREFLKNNAIYVNGKCQNEEDYKLDGERKYNIIRKGKKKYYLIKK